MRSVCGMELQHLGHDADHVERLAPSVTSRASLGARRAARAGSSRPISRNSSCVRASSPRGNLDPHRDVEVAAARRRRGAACPRPRSRKHLPALGAGRARRGPRARRRRRTGNRAPSTASTMRERHLAVEVVALAGEARSPRGRARRRSGRRAARRTAPRGPRPATRIWAPVSTPAGASRAWPRARRARRGRGRPDRARAHARRLPRRPGRPRAGTRPFAPDRAEARRSDRSVTLGAPRGRAARAAVCARRQAIDEHVGRDAGDRLRERQLHRARGDRRPGGPTGGSSAVVPRCPRARRRRLAVVDRPRGRIAQHAVGLGDLLEETPAPRAPRGSRPASTAGRAAGTPGGSGPPTPPSATPSTA